MAIFAAVLGLIAWLTMGTPPPPVHEEPSAPPAPFVVRTPEPVVPPTQLPAAAPPPILGARALASAQTTVQSQLSLLGDNQYDLFVQTFAEALRPQVTREAFESCRTRINQVPVKPDWEMAEESTDAGRRVVSVSIFGKSMTAFEETDGRWLAGSLWCVPTGLP